MKIVSWNVNGLRAILKKSFREDMQGLDPDIFCLQEIKLQEDQVDYAPENYHGYWNYAEKKGYSGVATFSKSEPLAFTTGINIPCHDTEGRVLTLDYGSFYLVNCYTPNSQNELRRLPYRFEWEQAFRDYLQSLMRDKSVILCGDLNVAHREIDLKNPAANRMNAGFSDEERAEFAKLLDIGFIDTFRFFYPELEDAYTWWSYRTRARDRNAGWRIDYFLISSDLESKLKSASIHHEIMGSDHCPVSIEIDL